MGNLKLISGKIRVLFIGTATGILVAGILAFIDIPYRAYGVAGLSVISILSLFWLFRILHHRMKVLVDATQELAKGERDESISVVTNDIFGLILNNINKVIEKLSQATVYVKHIGEGASSDEVQLSKDDKLGKALTEMNKKMQEIEEEEQKRTWVVEGLARFSEILRSDTHNLQELSFQIISNLVKYVGANQGGIFIEQEEESGEKHIELMAAYAYEKRKFLEKKVYAGQGLLGQCVLEKEPIYQTVVPENYVHITSGLGQAPPRNLAILPLIINEVVYGAIELATFHRLAPHQMEFLEKVAENIASTVAAVKVNTHTHRLLEESRKLTVELQSNEEEMRQNMEELSATQEEMQRKQAELDGVFSAIDMTIATVEFDLEGTITNVNDLYLGINGFEKTDLVGKSYTNLLSEAEKAKPQTQMMWHGLRSGQSFSGEFRNVNKAGREMWIVGTYSPISDLKGNPIKVMLLAQYTTHDKEKQKDLMGSLHALVSSVPMLEISVESKIKLVNDIFTDLLGYKKLEVVRKELDILLTSKSQQKARELIPALVKEGGFYETQMYFIKGTGEEKCFRTTFTAIKSLDDKVYKIIVLLLECNKNSV